MLRTQSDCFHWVQNCWEKEEDLGEFVNKLGSVLSGAQSGEARSLLVSFYCYSLPFPEWTKGLEERNVYSKLAVMWSIEILQRSEKISVSDISAETMVFGWILKVHGNYRAVKISEMSRLKDLFLVLPGLALVIIGGSLACPSQCSCSSSGVVVDCSDRGLTQIPNNLPKDAVTL